VALTAAGCGPGKPATGGGDEAAVEAAPDAILGAGWSHDGRRIAVSWYRGNQSRIYGLFGPTADGAMPEPSRGLPITAGEGSGATWSPDGLWVAFATTRGGNAEIYRVRPDGTGPENLTKSPSADDEPAYSPDGKLIAFTSDRDGGGPRLYVMNADGTAARPMADDLPGSAQHEPAWSPDGRLVAFTADEGNGNVIYVATLVGGGWGKLGEGGEPAWSHDGADIFFTQHDSIFSRAAGGGARDFVVADATAPAASPDGRWLTFVRGRGAEAALFILDLEAMTETRITS
jgi:Tol biopolymer transport system component